MKKVSPIIWGIAVIVLGVILAGNALNWFSFEIFFDGWWTLFIIIPSVVSLVTEKEKLPSLGFLAMGIILLLAARNVFSYGVAWKVILALFLVIAGLLIIIKSVFRGDAAKEIEKKINDLKDEKKMDSQSAVFSGNDRVYRDEVFNGSNLLAIFGGADLDLRKAKFNKDTVIKAFCLFGGIDVKVPEDVRIVIRSGFIFGGIEDERKSDKAKGKYTIYVDAAGAFGGVNIIDKDEK